MEFVITLAVIALVGFLFSVYFVLKTPVKFDLDSEEESFNTLYNRYERKQKYKKI